MLSVAVIAAFPWALGLPVLRWHPAMQVKKARRTYRWATFAVCWVFSAVSFFSTTLIAVWLITVVAAIWLDIHLAQPPQAHSKAGTSTTVPSAGGTAPVGPSTFCHARHVDDRRAHRHHPRGGLRHPVTALEVDPENGPGQRLHHHRATPRAITAAVRGTAAAMAATRSAWTIENNPQACPVCTDLRYPPDTQG